MAKEDYLETEEQHVGSDHSSEQWETLRQKKRIAWVCWVMCILVLFLFFAIIVTGYQRDLEDYPSEKLEAFLEYIFGQECRVEFDKYTYFHTIGETDYIPYTVYVTLKDGTKTYFAAQWKRNSSVDDGVYTDYDELLVSHYAKKYGITCYDKQYWYELMLTEENLTGTPSAFEQFMNALYDSDYIQAGQDILLWIDAENHLGGEQVAVNREEPLDVKEFVKQISN